jgi:glycosidase
MKQSSPLTTLLHVLSMGFLMALFACTTDNRQADIYELKTDPQNDSISAFRSFHPEWSSNASIYEVNIRQYTPEGTFKAFQKYLPKIKALGTDIIWLMPIHPIGKKNRKGMLGNYYAVQDYKAVNPEFGTMEDFKDLVKTAHAQGMYLIIDWVPNHTAWDHDWVEAHPDWYAKNEQGNFMPPKGTDWTDVIQLDYSNKELRAEMTKSLEFWLKEADIDGYRCDVAGKVPTDFWNNVRPRLDKIKPVFMLAEWEKPDLHEKAFDMTYAWELYDLMNRVSQGKANADSLRIYFKEDQKKYPEDAYRMLFVDNHDKNSWEGTMFKFGESLETFIALTCVAKGMPLVYTGQEIGLNRSLKFFEKDPIEWTNELHPVGNLYKKLIKLKKDNPALWNGVSGGEMVFIDNDKASQVLTFIREKESKKVLAIFNFSDKAQKVTLKGEKILGNYIDFFSNKNFKISAKTSFDLKPWEYKLLLD